MKHRGARAASDAKRLGALLDEVWDRLDEAGGALSEAALADLREAVEYGIELCVFERKKGKVILAA